MNKKRIFLSVIIPCYNEEVRLRKNLSVCLSYLQRKRFSWEVLIVDDGSIDKTLDVAKKENSRCPHMRVYTYKENRGKGAAIKKGVYLARGDYIVFMDIDLSVPIETIDLLLEKLKQFNIVIGVRRDAESKILRHQPWYREIMGYFFTKLLNLILVKGICDFTCGFKGFRSKVAKQLFARQRITRWAFDAEIVFLAKKRGFSIAQIPVAWSNDSQTKVNLFKDTVTTFLDILKIRCYNWLGMY